MRHLPTILGAAALTLPGGALAHHSFAVFFDPQKTVTIEGTVTQYRFTNPHGTLSIEVKKPDGTIVQWRAETNAPVILARRGWTRDSVKPGETVTISGWPARDGRNYLRLMEARDANGKLIGSAPFGRQDQS